MSHIRCLVAGLSLAVLPVLSPAFAQEQEQEQHSSLTIGAGAAVIPSYEGSDDYRVAPIVQARGKVHDFAFWTRGTALYVDAIPNRDDSGFDLELGPVVNVRLERRNLKQIKDAAVRALGERDIAIEVGGFVGVAKTGVITSAFDNLSARVAVTKDVGGAHESYVVTPTIEYVTPLSPTAFVGFAASADYVGKKYGRYYYDITTLQGIQSNLAPYSRAGDKAGFKKVNFNLTAGKSLSGDLRQGWAIFAVGGYSRILGRYADSPIVADAGSKNQWAGAIGIGYTF